MTNPPLGVRDILQAQVYGVAVETPTQSMPALSRQLGHDVRVKREDLQPIFSFKIRGAANKLQQLTPAARRGGVVAASAGNHAQGVALAASRSGIHATIVMPRTTPRIKVEAVRALGAETHLHGDNLAAALREARRLAATQGRTFIHPFDDREVIAGQGTVGVELLQQVTGPLRAVFVPVGGGGLLAGVATYVKYVRPEVAVIGVECDESACLQAALRAGRRVTLRDVGIFADGLAVAQVGRLPFARVRGLVDAVLTVTADEICGAIRDLFSDTRSIAEPAGAVALAGLKRYAAAHRPGAGALVALESGANVDFNALRYISERAEIGERREAILSLALAEKPGALAEVCGELHGDDVTFLSYRYRDTRTARFLIGVAFADGDRGRRRFLATLRRRGLRAADVTGNELAKAHVAHMIGGAPPAIADEFVAEFRFPERPGVLREFLCALGHSWNLTLFHYRKYGGEHARVLAGIAPAGRRAALVQRLKRLGFAYTEVSGNPMYRAYLAPPT